MVPLSTLSDTTDLRSSDCTFTVWAAVVPRIMSPPTATVTPARFVEPAAAMAKAAPEFTVTALADRPAEFATRMVPLSISVGPV
ncbi:MAG: hypothetical protein ACKO40_07450 [Planctomycetaceae bacterium]